MVTLDSQDLREFYLQGHGLDIFPNDLQQLTTLVNREIYVLWSHHSHLKELILLCKEIEFRLFNLVCPFLVCPFVSNFYFVPILFNRLKVTNYIELIGT